ncbi:mbt repeat containing protein [Sarcoptes scabiei]|uniref:Mbt repeat containing protein n=1 Tax=Sarcoptes scabiei TaxID=52283 RepID=A0A132A2U3_SARSC|nr:mbt repeat containing protein [Sarcoptes scabiei]
MTDSRQQNSSSLLVNESEKSTLNNGARTDENNSSSQLRSTKNEPLNEQKSRIVWGVTNLSGIDTSNSYEHKIIKLPATGQAIKLSPHFFKLQQINLEKSQSSIQTNLNSNRNSSSNTHATNYIALGTNSEINHSNDSIYCPAINTSVSSRIADSDKGIMNKIAITSADMISMQCNSDRKSALKSNAVNVPATISESVKYNENSNANSVKSKDDHSYYTFSLKIDNRESSCNQDPKQNEHSRIGNSDQKKTMKNDDDHPITAFIAPTAKQISSIPFQNNYLSAIRQPIQSSVASIKPINSNGNESLKTTKTMLISSKPHLKQQLLAVVAQQQSNSINIDQSVPTSVNQAQLISTKNGKRSFSKILSVNDQPSQQFQIVHNNNALIALNLNHQVNGTQQLSPSNHKRLKRVYHHQLNGHGDQQNSTAKRSRSKSISNSDPLNLPDTPEVKDINNLSLVLNEGEHDSNSILIPKHGIVESKSINSILINQLKKPVVVISSSDNLYTSNQAIQTNSSPLVLQLSSTKPIVEENSPVVAINASNQSSQIIRENFPRSHHPLNTLLGQKTIATSTIESNSSSGLSSAAQIKPFNDEKSQIFVQNSTPRNHHQTLLNSPANMASIYDPKNRTSNPSNSSLETNIASQRTKKCDSDSDSLTTKSFNVIEDIKALDEAILEIINTLPPTASGINIEELESDNSSSETNLMAASTFQSDNINSTSNIFSDPYPPIWWIIFEKYGSDRCAPVWSFPNAPLFYHWRNLFDSFECKNANHKSQREVYVEIQLKNSHFINRDLNENLEKSSSTTDSHVNGIPKEQFFWFAHIIGHSGYYLRLRYAGLEDISKFDFWVNFRERNLYPIGYAHQNNYKYRRPQEVFDANPNYAMDIKKSLANVESIESDIYSKFLAKNENKLRPGIKVEAFVREIENYAQVATITKIIGQRCLLKFDDPNSVEADFWTNINSENIRPIGWSCLVGHKLFAPEDYRIESFKYGVKNLSDILERNRRPLIDWNKFGILKKFEFIDSKSFFKQECSNAFIFIVKGMKLEVVNPRNRSSICVATVRKVLRFNFLVLSIDDIVKDRHQFQTSFTFDESNEIQLEEEKRMFCIHASSPYILPAGFCDRFSIPLVPPIGKTLNMI